MLIDILQHIGVRQVIVPIVNVNVGMKTTAIARGGAAASSGMDDDDNPLPAVPVRRDPSSAELEFNKFLAMVYPHHNEVKAASAIISSVRPHINYDGIAWHVND